ncbi:tetratricopeptide repeat protein [Cryobacterium psychrophilum]|uniref:Tetratricopeptide repeat protein n=1 Tax=Cryobacterium psychrophilum TaxID=41988 RepID=A0A4Y8KN81_9MICO|nr:tetratricopeptide repeat protein [Cryobacterium psychrophilum]TDW31252.1 putative thioredoxin [Cryobacterium psychrophilum]TFD78458.1 tetratricopeptide repeat protein [Cryobacterium psychrophilum]
MTQVPPSGSNLRGAVDLSSLVNRSATTEPRGAAAGTSGSPTAPGAAISVPSLVLDGTDANFGEILELSNTVPVLVDLWAEWCEPCKQLTPVIEKLVAEYAGRFVLAKVDVDSNPQLSKAFQAQSIPTVAAVINGQPVQLFNGALPEAQIREVLERVLELAAQQGVTGTAQANEVAPVVEEPVEEPLPPHHLEAYEAIERGDFETARAEYRFALTQNPNDTMAAAGLAQASLLFRLQGKTLDDIRGGAAAAPEDLPAQLLVADLDLSGGHVDDAFDRLLTLFPAQDAAGRNIIRERLLELFEVIGTEDPRVAPTRKRLTALLY